MKKDMNYIAKVVTLLEGKKKSLSIAQIKETLKCLKTACKDADVLRATLKYLAAS